MGGQLLSLELDAGDGAISGRLRGGDWAVEFTGWLALAAALERLRRGEDGALTRGHNEEPKEDET